MIPFNEMEYHPTSEQVVDVLCQRTQQNDRLFFRVLVAYYFAVAASHMRCSISTPNQGNVPVNLYVLNLAISGFGKGVTQNTMEDDVLNQFRHRFLSDTFPLQTDISLPILANKRAQIKMTDPDVELDQAEREFTGLGPMYFSFCDATTPAIKAMRHKLLMANAGALSLEVDEIGSNLSNIAEALSTYLEMYDKGKTKSKLILSTNDRRRLEEIQGGVPTNLLMYGTPSKLFDGAATEAQLYSLLEEGYARRCFFAYLNNTSKNLDKSAEEVFDVQTENQESSFLSDLSDRLGNLADLINMNKKLVINREESILLIEYKLHCEKIAAAMNENETLRKAEISHRYWKALKLAGAYAFIDDSPEITKQHLFNAIKLAEECGVSFQIMLHRDRAHVKLAKHIASMGQDITQADLVEDLPYYKGSISQKAEMLNLAISYGYKNNIIIKKSFNDGVEVLRGESLKNTDLNEMILAYSTDITTDYVNQRAPFDQLHKLTQAEDLHWVAHHLTGGYRNEENAIPGFNLVVIDVDGGTPISMAKLLLKDYKFLLYTTKRHTEEEHRYRIIFPINFELALDAKEYKEFMANIYQWLPFEVDTGTDQRARKWLSNNGHYEYNEGELLDALPFIPKTTRNEARKKVFNTQQSMDNLERWVINNIGDGNRNNMLLRYALILLDSGQQFEAIRQRVMGLNSKIPDKLEEAEVMGTIMITVAKALAKQ